MTAILGLINEYELFRLGPSLAHSYAPQTHLYMDNIASRPSLKHVCKSVAEVKAK